MNFHAKCWVCGHEWWTTQDDQGMRKQDDCELCEMQLTYQHEPTQPETVHLEDVNGLTWCNLELCKLCTGEISGDLSGVDCADCLDAKRSVGRIKTLCHKAQPDKHAQRKATPIYRGVIKYFPLAIAEVAKCSQIANEQHNPGTAMHWDRSKSGDELDALARHLMDAGTMDDDGIRHSTKVAWRALANLQKELEAESE